VLSADKTMRLLYPDPDDPLNPRMPDGLFDIAGIIKQDMPPADDAARMAQRIRQVGLDRILYGSDGATGGNLPPREAWLALRQLPLTDDEFAQIAGNRAPYLR
jgi:uncharacterized protein